LKVLIAGASGFIGRHLVSALSAAGHQVLAIARRPRAGGLRQIAGDFRTDIEPAIWLPRLQGIDAVINGVGILRESGTQSFRALHEQAPKALFEACVAARVHRVIQISALGAGVDAASRYHRSKGEADRYLASLPLASVIVQPSLVFGPGGASTRLFYTLAAMPLIPLPGEGRQRVQPVHIADLVQLCIRLLDDLSAPQRLAVVGPEVYSVRGLLTQVRLGMGLGAPRFVHVPMNLVRASAWLPGVRFDREALEMLERGSVAPIAPFRAALGAAPRLPLLAQTEAVAGPHPVADWARLNALLPLLRWSVAFVWIATGIVSFGLYPIADSYELLAQAGIPAELAPWSLYGAASLDLLLGVAIVFARRRRWLWRLQIAVIVLYTGIITVALPQFWLHPFGPVTKNLPLLALLFALDAFERRA
jgi:uncharacterized protein YbjT (DUF2867 family)